MHKPEYARYIERHNMEQIATEPTRENNILDLCFTNNPGLVHNLEVESGISEHNMVKI